MPELRFTKMHGTGNDFMVIDGINQPVDLQPQTIRAWAQRRTGVGFDQLLVVEHSAVADFKYRIFNADGGEVEHCGNGARCFLRFVQQQGMSNKNTVQVETLSGILELHSLAGGQVQVSMGVPDFNLSAAHFVGTTQCVLHAGKTYNFEVVSMGNPHAVILVDAVEELEIEPIAQKLQQKEWFAQSVNVGFVEKCGDNAIRLRVYERGAGETLACGSGACAAVVVGLQKGWLHKKKIDVSVNGGQLVVEWQNASDSVIMTGPAQRVYEGILV